MPESITLSLEQAQSLRLGFLVGGLVAASPGSQLAIPDSVYLFISCFLLITIGLTGGVAIGNSNPSETVLPAIAAALPGIVITLIGRSTVAQLPGIAVSDAVATIALLGAMRRSTLAEESGAIDSRVMASGGEGNRNVQSTGEPNIAQHISNTKWRFLQELESQ